MSVHIDGKQGLMRFYSGENSYLKQSPYTGILSFIWLTPRVVYVYGARGRIGEEGYMEGYGQFKELGAEWIVYEKSGGYTAPHSEEFWGGLWRIRL